MNLLALEPQLRRFNWPRDGEIEFDLSDILSIDTAGAWLLFRTAAQLRARGRNVHITGASAEARTLLDLIGAVGLPADVPQAAHMDTLEGIGRATVGRINESLGVLAFVGEAAATAAPLMLRPLRFRWRQVFDELAHAGHRALPIVGLLAFLLGVVIAYQGGAQLRLYGASIFIADLVGVSMVRELAPLITAIIVAGRTGSAYAAQIGTMKVTEEVDALRAIGIAPMELLVLPKLLALVIALPLLTVFADIMGILGGMLMSAAMMGVGFYAFIDRLGYAVTLHSYLLGVGKAPVFAAVIAMVGCYQGFQVTGSAESVGRRTTMSVVQAILLVIIIDAVFSVVFSWFGL